MASEVRSPCDPPGPVPAGSDSDAAETQDGSPARAFVAPEPGSDPLSREVLEAGGIGAWSWTFGTEIVAADRTARRIWGLPLSGPIALAQVLAILDPSDRERARIAALAALVPGERVEHTVRIARPGGERAWIEVRGASAASSQPPCLAGVCFDVTPRLQAEAELRRTRREARARFRELRALYNAAPVGLALFDRDLRQIRVNRRLAELLGDLPAEGGGSNLNIAPEMRATLDPLLRQAVETGEPRGNVEIERTSASGDRRLALDCQFYPLRNEAGAVTGVGVVVEDVTAFKAAVQAREILSRELSHRIKNLFAVVSSLVTLSARSDKGFQVFARALRGRIEALGRAHDYVRPSEWDSDASRDRTLTNLLNTVLAPFRGDSVIDGKPRIEIQGSDVPLGPFAATALALTLHELATNAAKYGALSRPAGKVGVTCEIKGDLVEIVWRERGGPPVAGPPEKEGFGSMLARRTFSADLSGAMEAEWRPEGLVLKLTAPLQRLAR